MDNPDNPGERCWVPSDDIEPLGDVERLAHPQFAGRVQVEPGRGWLQGSRRQVGCSAADCHRRRAVALLRVSLTAENKSPRGRQATGCPPSCCRRSASVRGAPRVRERRTTGAARSGGPGPLVEVRQSEGADAWPIDPNGADGPADRTRCLRQCGRSTGECRNPRCIVQSFTAPESWGAVLSLTARSASRHQGERNADVDSGDDRTGLHRFSSGMDRAEGNS